MQTLDCGGMVVVGMVVGASVVGGKVVGVKVVVKIVVGAKVEFGVNAAAIPGVRLGLNFKIINNENKNLLKS